MTSLRNYSVADVALIEECAKLCCAEHGEERIGGPFNWEHYRQDWELRIGSGTGVIFGYEKDGVFVGGLGGGCYINNLTGRLRAAQIFLYVRPEHRGGLSMARLFTTFENWAIEQQCHDVIMPWLSTMPEKTRAFYEHRGYREMETLFSKPTGVKL